MKKLYSFETSDLICCSITQEDTELLVRWRSLPQSTKYFKSINAVTKASHEEWYNSIYLNTHTRQDFVICYKGDGAKIGTVTLKDIDFSLRCAEIGYAVYEEGYRGKGLAKQAVKAITQFGAHTFNISSYTICAHKDNTASNRVALSCGFLYESTKDDFNYYRLELRLK